MVPSSVEPYGGHAGGLGYLTDELAAQIVERVGEGVYIGDAAESVGRPRDTVYAWLARGRAALRRDVALSPDDVEYPYARFSQDVERARGEANAKAVKVVTSLFDDDDSNVKLKAATFYLERTDPSNWGRSTRPDRGAEPDAEADRDREHQQLGAKFYTALRAILVECDVDVHDPAVIEIVRRHLVAAVEQPALGATGTDGD